MTKLNTSGVV